MSALLRLAAFVALCCLFSAPLRAGEWRVESGISTLGGFVAPATALSDRVTLRVPVYLGGGAADAVLGGADARLRLATRSAAVLADYQLGGGWRMTGGLALGGHRLTARAVDPEIDGTRIDGDITLELRQRRALAPIVALGWQRAYPSGWSVGADLGVKIARHRVSGSGATPGYEAQLAAEIDEINDALDAVPVVPFLSLSLGLRF